MKGKRFAICHNISYHKSFANPDITPRSTSDSHLSDNITNLFTSSYKAVTPMTKSHALLDFLMVGNMLAH